MPDLTSMAASLGALLKETEQTLAVTESSCGGLLSACLVSIPGASAYYRGGAVVYTRFAQRGLLSSPRFRHDRNTGQLRALCIAERTDRARVLGHDLGS